ncbi:hypothetical protein Hanom_Chr10g00929701 [Helianthus anomalus]
MDNQNFSQNPSTEYQATQVRNMEVGESEVNQFWEPAQVTIDGTTGMGSDCGVANPDQMAGNTGQEPLSLQM